MSSEHQTFTLEGEGSSQRSSGGRPCPVRHAAIHGRRGQALLEMVFVLPFILLLIMVVSEFGIYFYRSNVLENTTQTLGRMAARGATNSTLQSYLTTQISTFSPSLAVANSSGVAVTTWSSDTTIKLTVTATVTPVMPVGALNIFGGRSAIFPTSFTLRSIKTVYVE